MKPTLIQRADDAVLDLRVVVEEALDDNVVTIDEAHQIRRFTLTAQQLVHRANGAQRAAISVIRTGEVSAYIMSQFARDDDDPDDGGGAQLKVA